MKRLKKWIAIALGAMTLLCTCACAPETEEEKQNFVFTSKAIAAMDYAAYGITGEPESAQQISVTVYPVDATYPDVDWSVAWSTESEWAQGKNVEDYVTVEATSANGKTANVMCWQPFGEQIKLIATSRDNPNITDNCLLDYEKRVTEITQVDIIVSNLAATKTWIAEDGAFSIPYVEDLYQHLFASSEATQFEMSVGTVTPTLSKKKVEMKINDTLFNAFVEAGFSEEDIFMDWEEVLYFGFEHFVGAIEIVDGMTQEEYDAALQARSKKVKKAVRSCIGQKVGSIRFSFYASNGTSSREVMQEFSLFVGEDWKIAVASLSLSNIGNLLF